MQVRLSDCQYYRPTKEVHVGSHTKSMVCLSYLSGWCGSVSISFLSVSPYAESSSCLLLSVLFALCCQDKHLNPLDLPATVSSTAVGEGLTRPGGRSQLGRKHMGWTGCSGNQGPGKIAFVCHVGMPGSHWKPL